MENIKVVISVKKRQDGSGNTYHTVEGLHLASGKSFKAIEVYGYDTQYITTTIEQVKKDFNEEISRVNVYVLDVTNVSTLKELRA